MTPLAKPSLSVQSLSSESQERPKSEKNIEMSSGRIYAKGIRQIFNIVTYLCLGACLSTLLLTFIEPFFLVVEFNPPVIKPIIISSKDLFVKGLVTKTQ